MKLSEAIIKGCEGTYQVRGCYTDDCGGYCVMGAALLPKLPLLNTSWYSDFTRRFPVANKKVPHPENGEVTYVGSIMVTLNDYYCWPRLSIAEWVGNVVEPDFYKEAK